MRFGPVLSDGKGFRKWCGSIRTFCVQNNYFDQSGGFATNSPPNNQGVVGMNLIVNVCVTLLEKKEK